MCREDRQGNEHLVGVEARIDRLQVVGLGVLYWFDHYLRNEFYLMVDACEVFYCIEQECGACAEQGACLGCYY